MPVKICKIRIDYWGMLKLGLWYDILKLEYY